MSDLIQKSFRLPAEIVAYIEAQEDGRNVSEKLIRILEKYIADEHDLNKLLAEQTDQLGYWHQFARDLLDQKLTLHDFVAAYPVLRNYIGL